MRPSTPEVVNFVAADLDPAEICTWLWEDKRTSNLDFNTQVYQLRDGKSEILTQYKN